MVRHKIKPIPDNDQSKSIEQINLPTHPHQNPNSLKNSQTDKIVRVISKRKLKRQHAFLYWVNVISIILISSVNIPLFIIQGLQVKSISIGVILLFSLPVFLINSCTLVDTKADMCKLYFLFDGITVAVFLTFISIVGLIIVLIPPDLQIMLPLGALLLLDYFAFQGNSKVILAYCKYKRWETVVLKLSLFVGMLISFVLAVYFIINQFSALELSQKQLDQFQEIFLLYIFSFFALYMEIFNKINERDGSNQLQSYHLINHQGQTQEEILYEEIEQNKDNNASQTTTSKRKMID